MNSLLVIAMIALVGFSITSAAAIDLGDHETPDSMEGFKEGLQRLVQEVSEQIKENTVYDENMDSETFLRVNKLDEEPSIVTEEDAGDVLSAVEDDQSTENVDSGIHCRWRGRAGRCCQSVRVIKFRLQVCLTAVITPPTSIRIALSLNGHTIWRKTASSRHRYNICLKKGGLRLCITIYNLYVSSHSARGCLLLSGKFHFIRFHKHLGCFYRRYADAENLTAEKIQQKQTFVDAEISRAEETPLEQVEKEVDDVLRFHQ